MEYRLVAFCLQQTNILSLQAPRYDCAFVPFGTSHEAQAIEVISAVPGWVELIVPCTREAVEQIGQVVARLGADLPEDVLDSVAFAFRELVMNAVEWGGQLDPDRRVRITCVRTDRMLMYRIADPGPGFTFENLDHAAIAHPGDPIEHLKVRDEKGLARRRLRPADRSRDGR